MGLWRLNSSGTWGQVKKIYRLNSSGNWGALKNVWRLNSSGIWQAIYSALTNPSEKAPDVPKLYFVDPSNFSSTDLAYSTYKIYLTRGKWTQDPITFDMRIQRSTSASFDSITNIINETKTYTTYSDSDFTDQVPLNTANRPTLTNALIRAGNYFRGYVKATNEDGLFGEYFTPVVKPRISASLDIASQLSGIAFDITPNGASFNWNYTGFETIVAADVFSQTISFYPQGNTSGTPIYSQSISPGTSTTNPPVTTVTVSNTALQPNTTYTVIISAVMNDLWKTESVSLQTIASDFGDFTTAADKPAKPVITSATDVGANRPYNNGAVSLVWTQPTGGAAVTGYKIEYALGPTYSIFVTLVSNTGNTNTSGTFTGLDANKNHKFYVTALSASSNSDTSDPSEIVLITTVPDKPTGVSAVAGNALANVSYNFVPSSNNGGKSISFYRATSSPGSITASDVISPIEVTGLTNYTNYTFTVAAYNANGYSDESNSSNQVMPMLPAPVGSGNVTIEADSPSNYIFKITSYGTWSNSATTYDYAWQTSSDGGSSWNTRASSTNVLTIPNYNASSYKTQLVRLLVYGRNQTGPSISPLTSNSLTIFYTTPVINTFTVTGGELAASYSFTYTADDPAATVSLEYKLSSGSTWTAIAFPSSPGSITLSAGTYDFRLFITNSLANGASRIATATQNNIVISNIYSFAFGNILYPSTNGHIGLTGGSTTTIPSTGKYLSIFPGDYVGNTSASPGYMVAWSDSTKYVIRFDGYVFGNAGNAAYRVEWMATFYTNQAYVDVKIITKGSSVSGAATAGLYKDGVLVAGLPGPYTLSTGTTYRINFNGSNGSFGISYDEITAGTNGIMNTAGTKVGSGDDDVYYSITTSANYYRSPVVTIGSISGSTSTLSIPFTESNGCDYVTYTIRTGSYSGTIVQSSSALSSPINLSSLTQNTTYYITLTPFNYKNQSGSVAQTTATTAPPAPTVSFSSITSSSFTASWSATGATHYYIDIYNSSTLVSLSGYPLTNTTNTSASPFGLSQNTSYTVLAYSKNVSNGFLSTPTVSSVTTLRSGLTPTFGTNTRTSGGFNGSVTNYDANYTWGISTNSGSVSWGTPSGSTRPFSVTGLTAGSSATVTVTTSRTGYDSGSGTTSGQALSNLTTNPAYGTATSTSGGFTATISTQPNPTGGSYSVVSQTNGTATVNSSSGALTVTGLTAGQSSTVTVRYSLSGYNSVDITSTGSATANVAPFNGSVTISLLSGTAGRVGATYYVSAATASGTPTPTVNSYQWQYFNLATSTWTNITGATSSSYTISYGNSTYSDIGRTIRCRVTFSNGVSPNLDTGSNSITVDNPTITNVVSYYYSTASRTATKANGYPTRPPIAGDSFVVWYVEGYNMQGCNTRTVIQGTTQTGTTSSNTLNIYSSAQIIGDGTSYAGGIYRNTGVGGNGQTYALRIEPTALPGGTGAIGQRRLTNTVTNNATNQGNSPITNTLTNIASL